MISSAIRKVGPFVGNGSASVFPFTFKVFSKADLVVVRALAGAETTLVVDSDFTVALNADQDGNPGGSITLTAGALAVGFTLIISSNIEETQQTQLTNLGGFYPEVITAALDKLTILVQQLQERVDRSVTFPISDPSLDAELPSASLRLGKVLGFDSNTGAPVALSQTVTSSTGTYNAKDYGAAGDGVTDDTVAAAATLAAAAGGIAFFPAGTYKITSTLLPPSNAIVQGVGASTIFKFVPTAPFVGGVNDRLFHVTSQLSARRQMAAGAIAIGSTTFTANSSSDTADLVQGDWVIIQETDAGAGDIVLIDWVQVRSVAGAVVTVQSPFRKAFPNARTYSSTAGLAFVRVTNLKENITFRDFSVVQPDAGAINPSLSMQAARNTRVENVIVDNADGGAFYTYKAQGVTITNCLQKGSQTAASEMASTVDLSISGCQFGQIGTANNSYAQANTSALTLDLGTAFFAVTGNRFYNAGNGGVQLTYGVSDGIFANNVISWVRNAGNVPNGIIATGLQRVLISNNLLDGGSSGNTGISLAATSTFTVNITSQGNVIWGNSISNFTNRFGTQAANDIYFNPDTSFPRFDLSAALNVNSNQAAAIFRQTSSTSFTGMRIQNDLNLSTRALEIDYSGSAYATPLITGAPSGEAGVIVTNGAFPLVLGTNNTARIVINADGTVALTGGSKIINGSGSPAGVVSAPVGSLYLRTDGGTSTTLYVKESGTGTSGWVAK